MAFTHMKAAYDTVWRKKLLFTVLYPKTTNLINGITCNRLFQVTIGNSRSKLIKLNNKLDP